MTPRNIRMAEGRLRGLSARATGTRAERRCCCHARRRRDAEDFANYPGMEQCMGDAPSLVPTSPGEGEEARGRRASTPSEIPARGWKDILKRCYQRLNDDRILAIAAGVTFYALLAIFPAIAALVSIYGLFADPGTITKHLDDISSMVP